MDQAPRMTGERLVPSQAKDSGLVEEKQARIAAGAGRVFFQKGFHRTTIREIAIACGMSMGQLYHYISSKDDVLFLVYCRMQERWLENLQSSRLEEIADPGERLVRALERTLEFVEANQELFLFLYTETKYLEPEHLRAVLAMDDRNVVGFFGRLLSEVGLAGEAEPLADLLALIMVFPALRGWNLDRTRSQENRRAVVRFVLKGLGLQEPEAEKGLP